MGANSSIIRDEASDRANNAGARALLAMKNSNPMRYNAAQGLMQLRRSNNNKNTRNSRNMRNMRNMSNARNRNTVSRASPSYNKNTNTSRSNVRRVRRNSNVTTVPDPNMYPIR